MSARGRQAAIAAIGLAAAIVAIVPFALWWRRFPDPMASHWGFVGGPNGSTSKGALAVILVGPAVPPPSSPAGGSVGLRPGERVSWTGYARAPLWLPLSLAGLAALIVVVAITGRSPQALIGVAALAVAAVATSWIRVSVDWRGLRIRYGPLPWPVTKSA